MVDWKLFLKRGLRAWSRMWHLHDPCAYVLMGILIGVFVLSLLLIGSIIDYFADISNTIFFLLFIPSLFMAWIVTIKVSDYFDMHGW